MVYIMCMGVQYGQVYAGMWAIQSMYDGMYMKCTPRTGSCSHCRAGLGGTDGCEWVGGWVGGR